MNWIFRGFSKKIPQTDDTGPEYINRFFGGKSVIDTLAVRDVPCLKIPGVAPAVGLQKLLSIE